MEIGTMRYFDIKKIAVLAYLVLLCIVAAVSAKKVMSNVPDAANQLKEFGDSPSGLLEGFKKCLICGCSHAGPEENMISGDPVEPPNKYPWMVLVINANSSLCGGTILDGYHILTAAHCVLNMENCTEGILKTEPESCKSKPEEMKVILPSTKSKGLTETPSVKEIFMHPQYRLPMGNIFKVNDVAVVKLNNPITCDAFASPICLPASNFSVPPKTMLNVAGWGVKEFHFEDTTPTTPSAQEENAVTLPPPSEALVLPTDKTKCGFKNDSEASVLCVVGSDGKSPCFGDSGSPVFFKDKVFYTLGVASTVTSIICAGNEPVIYADVSKLIEFIKEKTGLQSAQVVEVQSKNGGKRNKKRKY